jgi:hypothetical protein
VYDRLAEGALGLRALDVDLDLLVVVVGVGEEVAPVQGDLYPVADAELGSLQRVVVVVVIQESPSCFLLWWSARGAERADALECAQPVLFNFQVIAQHQLF